MKNTIIQWELGHTLPEAFLCLPYQLYEHDPYWLPENTQEVIRAFSEKNPYFQRSTASVWTIANEVRLAGFFNPDLLIKGETVAFFGFWEATDNLRATQKVFTCFEKWAHEKGAKNVYGPINFNTYGKYRIRLNSGAEEGCFHGEPYNPDYYQNLLQACGYSLHTAYQSQYIAQNRVSSIYEQKEALRKKMEGAPFRIVNLQPHFWLERLEEMFELINLTFRNNFAYTPISFKAFESLYGQAFAQRFCPNLSVVALDEKEKAIGFAIGLPDYAPLCRNGLEKPLTLSEISYGQHFPLLESPTLLLKTLGVHPTYQKAGLMNAMGIFLMSRFRTYYSEAMACLMREDNFSTYFFKDMGVKVRSYGLFRKRLG